MSRSMTDGKSAAGTGAMARSNMNVGTDWAGVTLLNANGQIISSQNMECQYRNYQCGSYECDLRREDSLGAHG